MKPFLFLEEITSISFSKTSQTSLEFVPSFPGIYIDLDTKVIPDDCDHFLGMSGMGSEFYLKNERISKMFIELLPYQSIEIMDRKFNDFIDDTVLYDTTICELKVSNPTKRLEYAGIGPDKIWISLDLDSAFVSFGHYELDPDIKTVKTLRDVEYVAIDEKITLGFNLKSNALCAVFIKDFTNAFEHCGISLTEENTDKYRIASLKNLSYHFFKEHNSKSYTDLIKRHKSSFRTQSLDGKLKDAEDKILESLQSQHEGFNKIFYPEEQKS